MTFEVGDVVKIVSIPDWLIHDLPPDDQQAVLATVGTVTTVTEVQGIYYWVGTNGGMRDFILTEDCLLPV